MSKRSEGIAVFLSWGMALVVVLASQSAWAAQKTATWTGSGDGVNYSNPANWDIDGGGNPGSEVPLNNATDTYVVVISSGSVTFDVPDPVAGTNDVFRMTLASGRTLTIDPARNLSVIDSASIGGTVQTTSGTFSAPSAASMITGNTAKVSVNGTGSVNIGAASYDSRGITSGVILSADGSGASLSLPLLQTLTDSADPYPAHTRTIQALNSATVDLSGLTVVHGATGDDWTQFVESSGGTIDLSSLLTANNNVSFTSSRSTFSLPALKTAGNMKFALNPGYTLNLTALEQQTGGTYLLAASDTVNLDKLTSLKGARVTISDSASTFAAPLLGNIDDTFFNLSGGARLVVAVPNYVGTGFSSGTFFSADGTNTLLDLSSISTVNSGTDYYPAHVRTIAATNSGVVNLAGMQTLNGGTGDDVVEVKMVAGGVVMLNELATTTGNVRFNTDIDLTVPKLKNAATLLFTMQPGSTLNLPELIAQTGGAYDLPAGATVNLPKLATATGTTFSISDPAATLNAPLLANVNNSFLNISGGAQLALPGVTNYVGTGFASGTFMSAAGPGTLLDLSGLEAIDGYSDYYPAHVRTISASDGGKIDLSGVTSLRGGAGDDKLRISVSSSGVIDLSSLQSVPVGTAVFDVEAEGTLKLGNFTVTGNSTFNINDVTSVVDVAGSLLLDSVAVFKVATGGGLSVGGNFSFATQNETAFTTSSGILAFDGAGTFGSPQFLEVGGLDAGTGDPGNSGNFGIGQLVIGTDDQTTVVSLVDVIDNGNRASPEALYLFGLGGPDGLLLRNGSTLVIDNIPVYAWVNGGWIRLNDLFTGGANSIDFGLLTNNPADSGFVAIPEPASLGLLAFSGLAIIRRRKN